MNVTPIFAELRTADSSSVLEAGRDGKIVSDSLYDTFEIIVSYWMILVLSSLGVVTNSLTMVVFLHQGFRDSVNVSLFSIAVWDQIKCLAGVIFRLYKPIGLINPVWGIKWRYLTLHYLLHLPLFAGYVSYALATYVSVERCLSVSIPFKVKSLITARLTASFMIGISLVVFGSFSPVFLIYTVRYTFSPVYNVSLPRTTPHDLYNAHGQFIIKMFKFLGIFYPAVFCTIMITTSAIIVYNLRKSGQIFNKDQNSKKEVATATVGSGGGSSSSRLTPREVKVTKMLTVVILIYLMHFFPRLCIYVASSIEPEFFTFRRYHNLIVVVTKTVWIFDFINGSVNFFIFMRMSTNFRKTFYVIFPRCQPREREK